MPADNNEDDLLEIQFVKKSLFKLKFQEYLAIKLIGKDKTRFEITTIQLVPKRSTFTVKSDDD